MQQVLSFIVLNKELILFLDKDKLCYGKKENGNLTFNLDVEEIKLILQVLSKFLPSKTLISMGYTNFKNKKYNHFFDYESGIHHFLIDDALPSFEDYRDLDIIYNQRNSECLLSEIKNEELEEDENNLEDNTGIIKRYVNIGRKSIVVLASITLIYILNALFIKNGPPQYKAMWYSTSFKVFNSIEKVTKQVFNRNVTLDEIAKTLIENPNLTSEEKDFYYNELAFLEDQAPYIDKDDYLDTLKKLDIVYKKDKNSLERVQGSWDKNYKITMYGTSGFDNTINYLLRHECYHTVSQKEALKNSNNAFIIPFYESLNRQISNEYEKDLSKDWKLYDNSYEWLEEDFYRIAGLISPKTLRQFHAIPNSEYLIVDLLEINKDLDKAYQLFDALYTYDVAYKAINFKVDKYLKIKTLDEWQVTLDESRQKLDDLLKEYYEKKYGKLLNEDISLMYLYDKKQALEIIKKEINYDDSLDYMFLNSFIIESPKYFNQDSKNNFTIAIPKPWKDLCDEFGNIKEEEDLDFYYYFYDLKDKKLIDFGSERYQK